MAVVGIQIYSRSAYANGREFGEFGSYEIIEASLKYEIDPDDSINSRIVDIALAPMNSAGKVEFSGDLTLILPLKSTPRAILVDVPNRGNRLAFRMLHRSHQKDLAVDPFAAGDGFLFERGIAYASVGWQWGLSEGMGLEVPNALSEGKEIRGQVICRVQPNKDSPSISYGQLGNVVYVPADPHDTRNRLYEQENDFGERHELPIEAWQFGRVQDGFLSDDNKSIYLRDGFKAGRIYTLVFWAEGAPIVGLGLLALRDAALFLKSEAYPGKTPYPSKVIGFGASQTGRVLRHFLYEGLNEGADGKAIYDGLLPHIAGGQRGDFNHRFAQPSSLGVHSLGQCFPFAGREVKDPFTKSAEGVYKGQISTIPKVILTNTSVEYWRGDGALTHVMPDGKNDIEPLSNERIYLFSGTHHVNGIFPKTNTNSLTGLKARYDFNTIDHSPLLRGALNNLFEWVVRGTEPPHSRIPTISEGTLVGREHVLDKFLNDGRLELVPEASKLGGMAVLDLGPESRSGVCDLPAKFGKRYVSLVSDIDECMNECAGIRLPDICVPIGFHTGWNPRHPEVGAEKQATMLMGMSYHSDPVSLYSCRDEYERLISKSAMSLARERLITNQDIELVIKNAMSRYDSACEGQ